MRWKLFLLPAILLLGFAGYRNLPWSKSRAEAAAMMERSFAAGWSMNERSIPMMEERVKEDPKNPRWNADLGEAFLQRARESGDPSFYTKAEALFDRALAVQPQLMEAMLGKASLAMARHDFHDAREMARKAVALHPDVVATYGVLADALVELGEYDEAIRSLDQMIRRKPNLSSYSRVSYLRELMGDTEGATQAMQMAVQSGSPYAENTAWCMVQLGNLYLNAGKTAEAEMQYQSALTRFPDYAHAWGGLARLAVARKDSLEAVRYYKLAMDQIPLPEFAIGLGEVYEQMGRHEEAQSQFDLVEAIQRIHRSNGVSVDIEMALFDADRGKNVERAIAVAQREWNSRKSVRVADVYAWALYRAGRVDEARRMMQQALRLGTRDPLFLRHAAAINSKTQKES
jgi:tetratricopeptide (TPR) repeat protein